MAIVERWGTLDSQCKKTGARGCDDNDLWIAATAIERDMILVTCDRPQSRLPGLRDPIYLDARLSDGGNAGATRASETAPDVADKPTAESGF